MKSIEAKYISGMESMSDADLLKTLETATEYNPVACVNWKEYPYQPAVKFRIAQLVL